jgi:hypothetical protein
LESELGLKPDLVLENPTQNQFWNRNQNFLKIILFGEKKSGTEG